MCKIILLAILALGISCHPARAQISALEQLELDLSKLSDLKGTLQDMYTNYVVLKQEYGQLQNVTKGNFLLHLSYLNSLLSVSDHVQSDTRIGDISTVEQQILLLYQLSYARYNASVYLSPSDKASLNALYEGILTQSAEDMDELNLVLTPGALSMTDDERLAVINRIDQRMQVRLANIKAINQRVGQILQQRGQTSTDINNLRKLYGL